MAVPKCAYKSNTVDCVGVAQRTNFFKKTGQWQATYIREKVSTPVESFTQVYHYKGNKTRIVWICINVFVLKKFMCKLISVKWQRWREVWGGQGILEKDVEMGMLEVQIEWDVWDWDKRTLLEVRRELVEGIILYLQAGGQGCVLTENQCHLLISRPDSEASNP